MVNDICSNKELNDLKKKIKDYGYDEEKVKEGLDQYKVNINQDDLKKLIEVISTSLHQTKDM